MSVSDSQPITITVNEAQRVSGLMQSPSKVRACYVLAHGAGAGMAHPFLANAAKGLSERGVATLLYQFPYMERGSNRPDKPELAQAAVRAATLKASELLPH